MTVTLDRYAEMMQSAFNVLLHRNATMRNFPLAFRIRGNGIAEKLKGFKEQ